MYSTMQAIFLSLYAPLTPGVGLKGQNNFPTENGHIAYQIKENGTYNIMQAISSSLQAPLTLWWDQKVKNVF